MNWQQYELESRCAQIPRTRRNVFDNYTRLGS